MVNIVPTDREAAIERARIISGVVLDVMAPACAGHGACEHVYHVCRSLRDAQRWAAFQEEAICYWTVIANYEQ